MLTTATAPKTIERPATAVLPIQSAPEKSQLVAQWVVEGGQLVCKWMTR